MRQQHLRRQHFERTGGQQHHNRLTGTHGTDSGTALYVPDKDYEKALEIIAPIADRMHEAIPFCPKCGSDNVTPIAPSRYTTAVIIASVILGLGSGFYPWWSLQLGIQSGTGSIIAGVFLLLAIFMAMSTVNAAESSTTANPSS